MATLLNHPFSGDPDGPPPEEWVLTGANIDNSPGLLRVDSGLLHLTTGHTNGYAQRELGGLAEQLIATFVFGDEGPGDYPDDPGSMPVATLCLINCGRTVDGAFDKLNMRMHLVMTPTNFVWQIREEGGEFESVWAKAWPRNAAQKQEWIDLGIPGVPDPLPRNTLRGLIVTVSNATVTMQLPDGSGATFSDARIASMPHDTVVVQGIRGVGTWPEGRWSSVTVNGTPTAPEPQAPRWRPAYVTLDDAKRYLGVGEDDGTYDAQITRDVEAASRAVDRECRRQFGSTVFQVERFYRPQYEPVEGYWYVVTDDIAQTQSSPVVVSGDAGEWTYPTDITSKARPLHPNAAVDGRPNIGFKLSGSYRGVAEEVRVKAVFGWDAVPVTVQDAVLLQTHRLFKRKDAPFGIAGSPSGDGEARLLSKLDPDVALMLRGYTRRWSAA